MASHIILNFSAFTGPDLDKAALLALLSLETDYDKIPVINAFETKVNYKDNKRPWEQWLSELGVTLSQLSNTSSVIVTGQAPGSLYGVLAATLHHPERSVTFVNPRFKSVLSISEVLREDNKNVSKDIKMMATKYYEWNGSNISKKGTEDVCIGYIGFNPLNAFTQHNFIDIINEVRKFNRYNKSPIDAVGIGINSDEPVRIDDINIHGLYACIKSMLFQTNDAIRAKTIVISCSSMDAICYLAAAEAVRTRNGFDQVFFAERLSNGGYHLIPLRSFSY